jgi:hypothetical protein
MVRAAIEGLGLSYSERQFRNGKWSSSCEGETFPGYTARATAFETAVSMSAAYSIYSAAAHAEWHAVIAGFRQEPLPDGGTVLVSRPDLVAVADTPAQCLLPQGSRSCPPTGRSGCSSAPQGCRNPAITLAGPKT